MRKCFTHTHTHTKLDKQNKENHLYILTVVVIYVKQFNRSQITPVKREKNGKVTEASKSSYQASIQGSPKLTIKVNPAEETLLFKTRQRIKFKKINIKSIIWLMIQ